MLKRNGFMPAVSVGAFADKTLVGNEKTFFCLGYCIDEEADFKGGCQ